MAMQKVGAWASYGNMLKNAAGNLKKKSDQIITKAAVRLASDIKINLTSGGNFAGEPFEPLDPKTIAAKGSSAPLLDKGDMRNSVTTKKLRADPIALLVGIPGDSKSKDGKSSVAEYARAHEFGAITSDGRIIKKRAFIGPTVEKTRDQRLKEIDDEFKKIFEF